jgi:hypothetical protein
MPGVIAERTGNFDYAVQTEKLGADCEEDRREFLKSCGRFAAWTPPLVTVLLSTSLTSNAIGKSTGAGGSSIRDRRQTASRQDGAKQGSRVTGTSCRSLLRLDRITPDPARGPFCDCEEAPLRSGFLGSERQKT